MYLSPLEKPPQIQIGSKQCRKKSRHLKKHILGILLILFLIRKLWVVDGYTRSTLALMVILIVIRHDWLLKVVRKRLLLLLLVSHLFELFLPLLRSKNGLSVR
ncbi:uncharacterized protein DS421_5g148180 [Arachis hypogaea]|nr:uncharacterized protein DS421_5g148180 [Arachis hypogaea]